MILSVKIDNRAVKFDSEKPIDISIPLHFNAAQPNAFGVEQATATACETGNFVGDTRRGGSCNFEQIKFIPHCNGTHTECAGHVTNERISIYQCLKDSFIFANLISLEPENVNETDETYPANLSENDKLITRKMIESVLTNRKSTFGNLNYEGLIIRTLPNNNSKLTRTYLEEIPPFFSTEAMNYIAGLNVKHLLVDLPSIDRLFDEGKLSNHRAFWNIAPGTFELNEKVLINNTITEMIFAPDSVADGAYLLNLQIAAFVADASPSRPRLFEIFSV